MTKRPGTARERVYTSINLGTLPRLHLPPGGRLGTSKSLTTGATFQLEPLRLPNNGQHFAKNVPCRADFLARVNGAYILSPYLCMKEN